MRPPGRPTIELEPTDHPLAIEQRHGIPSELIAEIAERFMPPPGAR